MIEKKWLAGFIDGEGCFNFTKCRKNIYPRLIITNTNYGILLEIKEQYGGDISTRNLNENWKDLSSYRACWKSLRKILKDVFPFLKLKKEIAKLCLDALKNKNIEKRKILAKQSKVLNKKGK